MLPRSGRHLHNQHTQSQSLGVYVQCSLARDVTYTINTLHRGLYGREPLLVDGRAREPLFTLPSLTIIYYTRLQGAVLGPHFEPGGSCAYNILMVPRGVYITYYT